LCFCFRYDKAADESSFARAEILKLYPYLEDEDIAQALKYAAWRAEEVEMPLQPA